jgi:hypothetical protein
MSHETTSETPSFCRPNRSRLVGLALRPSTPAPREQRQPKCEQRAEATDSEAHGIPAGPVLRFRSGLRRAVWLAPLASETIEAVGLRTRPPAAVTATPPSIGPRPANEPHRHSGKSGFLGTEAPGASFGLLPSRRHPPLPTRCRALMTPPVRCVPARPDHPAPAQAR